MGYGGMTGGGLPPASPPEGSGWSRGPEIGSAGVGRAAQRWRFG